MTDTEPPRKRCALEEAVRMAAKHFGNDSRKARIDLWDAIRSGQIRFFCAGARSELSNNIRVLPSSLPDLRIARDGKRVVGPATYMIGRRRAPFTGPIEMEIFPDCEDLENRYREERAQQFSKAPGKGKRASRKTLTALAAIRALWPDDVPPQLTEKQQHEEVDRWCKSQTPKLLTPSLRTIQKALTIR